MNCGLRKRRVRDQVDLGRQRRRTRDISRFWHTLNIDTYIYIYTTYPEMVCSLFLVLLAIFHSIYTNTIYIKATKRELIVREGCVTNNLSSLSRAVIDSRLRKKDVCPKPVIENYYFKNNPGRSLFKTTDIRNLMRIASRWAQVDSAFAHCICS